MNGTTTLRQREILSLLDSRKADGEPLPSYQEIGEHLGIGNVSAVAKHVASLRRKGLLATTEGKSRSIRIQPPYLGLRRCVAHIPHVGSIPAGPPGDREQEAEGCVSVDVESVGIRPTSRTFALRISGDSMVGKHIVDGVVVVIEHGNEPKPGDVFAATLDEALVLHHLATVLGLCRKAASTTAIPTFRGAKTVHLGSAEDAVRRLWRVLGWADSTDTTEIAFGLASTLHSDFFRYRGAALNQCRTFDRQFPMAFATDRVPAPTPSNL